VAAPTPVPTATAAPAPTPTSPPRLAVTTLRVAINVPPNTGDIFNELSNLYRWYWANLTDDLVHAKTEDYGLVGLSGVERWQQISKDRWRFYLRKGVKFHNGEPFNAEAAKFGIDKVGDPKTGSGNFQYAGRISGEVVDEYTVDVVCVIPCPALPVNVQYVGFQAPAWYQSLPKDPQTGRVNAGRTIGIGPFKLVEWRRGEFVKQERYDDYVPAAGLPEAQKSIIKDITYVWREEAPVRAAMLIAKEVDLVYALDLDDIGRVPVAKVGGETSVFSASLDNMWHPWLKQTKFRQALAHAVDCKAIVDSLFKGQTTCRGNIIFPGVLGATKENTTWYKYDPELSKRLLKEVGYNGEEIQTFTESGRAIRKQLEVVEAITTYWKAAGINTKISVIEFNRWSEIWNSGAGSCADPLKALEQGPCPPTRISRGILFMAPTNATLDFARHLQYYIDCSSKVAVKCDTTFWQNQVAPGLSAVGEDRKRIMETLATKYHDEVMDIGFFDIPIVWGMAPGLVWTPRFDGKIRANVMYFR
jgi:peptide/nickel transport system substrate-binding protein